jgi:hypothetical protein
MSSANLVSVIAIEEATYDTTPATGTWDTARITSESLSATPQVNSSSEIRSDRMVADQFVVSTASEGSLDFEFSAGGLFDTLLEGAMYDSWTADVLTVGTEQHSYSIEKEFTDLTANHFLVFSGMRVGGMSLGFTYGEAVTGSFTMAGASVTPASATQVVTGVTAATTSRVMNAVSDMTSLKIAGTTFTGCIRGIQLAINNNLRPSECVGSDTPGDQIEGTAEITGSIEAYLTDTTVQWYTSQILNQTQFDIEFTLSDGTNTYTFDLPNCRISGSAPNAQGINTDVMIQADFTALYDSGSSSSLTITRT